MENTKPSVFKSALPYGLILAVAVIVYTLLLYSFDAIQNTWLAYLTYLIVLVFIVLGIKNYRDKKANGFISFGQAFMDGFYIVLIYSVITAVFNYLFYAFFDPSLIDKMMVLAEEKILEQNPDMPQEQIDMAMSYSKIFMKPTMIAIMGLVWNVIVGGILSLIVAAIMKKEDKSLNTIM